MSMLTDKIATYMYHTLFLSVMYVISFEFWLYLDKTLYSWSCLIQNQDNQDILFKQCVDIL